MANIDWKGIDRIHRAMGGEGAVLLLLKGDPTREIDTLRAAIQSIDGDNPANGDWFLGPSGWQLLVEGMPDQIEPWLKQLASHLSAAGIDDTITGAPRARMPPWAKAVDRTPRLSANIGFRIRPGHSPYGGWGGEQGSRAAAVDAAMSWLASHHERVMVHGEMDSRFWANADQARCLLESADVGERLHRTESFSDERQEVRAVWLLNNARMELSAGLTTIAWSTRVDALRSALLSMSVQSVAMAQVTHRRWAVMSVALPGSEYCHADAYQWHPELWSEYLIDASGIQIVTDQHLAKAADLSRWNISQLDDTHHLLEAPDLEPWFDEPARVGEQALPEVIHEARRDFGDMILTRERAEELGITAKPPRPTNP